MNIKFTFAFYFLLFFTSTVYAKPPVCSEVDGTIVVSPDEQCEVLFDRARYRAFPDARFVTEQGAPAIETCVAGEVDMYVGDLHLTGTTKEGQTENVYPPLSGDAQLFTAADIIRLTTDDGRYVGKIFAKHVALIDFSTTTFNEYISIVGGSRSFSHAKGTLNIEGNLFSGAKLTGTICM